LARIETERLDLVPQTADALDALIEGNRARLEALTGARWPEPLEAPPLMADALPWMRDQLRADPPPTHWGWLIVVRATRQAVGSLGLAGEPDAGAVQIGYTIYPQFEGQGYATEAARAAATWALRQPGVTRLRATIPPWHAASLRVAAKIGMTQTGTAQDDDVGEVLVFERLGETAPPPTAPANG
jgi:[ribosomal protein S5]-alanine N-acetyltransferase